MTSASATTMRLRAVSGPPAGGIRVPGLGIVIGDPRSAGLPGLTERQLTGTACCRCGSPLGRHAATDREITDRWGHRFTLVRCTPTCPPTVAPLATRCVPDPRATETRKAAA
jgi:hypothetical protein